MTGEVKRVLDFGAFVELEPGIEALVKNGKPDFKEKKRLRKNLKWDSR